MLILISVFELTYYESVAVVVVVICRSPDVGGVFSRKSKADCGSASSEPL